jgi:DNA-binding SARP family transcriptional activator
MPANNATTNSGGFSAAERAATKKRAAELRAEGKQGAKQADGLQAMLDRGDLLEDAPFEEWALLDREQLRVQYLETLDRIPRMRFELGRYASCIEVWRRLARATCAGRTFTAC